jgi:hypothetical protein
LALPVHGPLQPVKIEPSSAKTPVSVSTVPGGKFAEHAPVGTFVLLNVQLIAPDVSETTPSPVSPLADVMERLNDCADPEAVIIVESCAAGGAADPPPETLAVFTCGEPALLATFNFTVITG